MLASVDDHTHPNTGQRLNIVHIPSKMIYGSINEGRQTVPITRHINIARPIIPFARLVPLLVVGIQVPQRIIETLLHMLLRLVQTRGKVYVNLLRGHALFENKMHRHRRP